MVKRLLSAAVLVGICLMLTTAAVACTSVVLPPGSTVEGFSSVTHTCDSGNSPYEFFKVPAKNWPRGSMVDVLNIPQYSSGYQLKEIAGQPTGNKIPQVPHTYGYLSSAIFGYMNEKQVGMGETTIGSSDVVTSIDDVDPPAGTYDAPAGYLNEALLLVTNDPRAKQIPVFVEGRILDSIWMCGDYDVFGTRM